MKQFQVDGLKGLVVLFLDNLLSEEKMMESLASEDHREHLALNIGIAALHFGECSACECNGPAVLY